MPLTVVMQTTLPSPAKLVQIVLGAVAAGIVGGLYPVFRAARVVQIEALRYE
jgi:ABC-type antimicrobial peptide transport system permease subunit